MSVIIFNYGTKKEIFEKFECGYTKTQLADIYCCSTRTIGRVIDEVRKNVEEQAIQAAVAYTEPVPVVERYKYYAVTDDNMISVIRVDSTGLEPVQTEIAYAGTDRFLEAKLFHQYGKDAEAFLALSKKHQIESLCMGKVTVHPEKGILEYNDGSSTFMFPADLTERVVEAMRSDEKTEVDALMNFANRLANNPSKRAVHELYGFLKASDIKIREDGMILCFKKVRDDYRDVHSGRFDNSVGQVPSMPRSLVDDDSSRTCSSGLHVCAKSYLNHFGGSRVMLCAVDPADVVSIPSDYNHSKMRCCKYEVVAEVTGQV